MSSDPPAALLFEEGAGLADGDGVRLLAGLMINGDVAMMFVHV